VAEPGSGDLGLIEGGDKKVGVAGMVGESDGCGGLKRLEGEREARVGSCSSSTSGRSCTESGRRGQELAKNRQVYLAYSLSLRRTMDLCYTSRYRLLPAPIAQESSSASSVACEVAAC